MNIKNYVNESIASSIKKLKLVDAGDLNNAILSANEQNTRLDIYLHQLGLISENQKAIVQADVTGIVTENIELIAYSEDIVKSVKNDYITKTGILPLRRDVTSEGKITYTIAINDAFSPNILANSKALFDANAKIILSTPSKVKKIQDLVFSKVAVQSSIDEYDDVVNNKKAQDLSANLEGADLSVAPAVRLAESILKEAIATNASDVHIEPYETTVRVRCRVDGVLYERASFAPAIFPALLTRFKIVSGMNIAERRVPQDGRFTLTVNDTEYDFRVSTLPVANGEKIVIRILDTTSFGYNRFQLGFTDSENQIIDKLLSSPHGIILLTGPTGCGKSTTLYSFIKEINTEGINTITVEDPIEYTIEGVNQVQVNQKANMTFANALRSILRQDPNVIMIGEIRDEETAHIAIRSAITGHLVFSTLHTNDAPGAVSRLIDMGVEPYFVADALNAVIAQRLVRRICPDCKRKCKSTPQQNSVLGISKSVTIFEPVGCPACHGTGFRGRLGIHEIFVLDQHLRSLINSHASLDDLRDAAVASGMLTLKDSCTKAVLDGVTSYSELLEIIFSKDISN